MTKKETQATVDETVRPSRTPRATTTVVFASPENDFTGKITVNVIGADPLEFSYQTPAISDWLSRAITAGIKYRLSTVIGGLKEVADIVKALQEEIVALGKGEFAVRTAGEAKAEYNDSIVAIAMSRSVAGVEGINKALYDQVIADIPLLDAVKAEWDAEGTQKAKDNLLDKVARVAKAGVAFFKKM